MHEYARYFFSVSFKINYKTFQPYTEKNHSKTLRILFYMKNKFKKKYRKNSLIINTDIANLQL